MGWQLASILLFVVVGGIDLIFCLQFAFGWGIGLIALSQLATGGYAWVRLLGMDRTLPFYLDAQTKQRAPVVLELWEEYLMLLGAYLLLFPGFLTDLLGFLLLSDSSRGLLMELARLFRGERL